MHVRVFTLTFDADAGRFRDEALREFVKDKRVVDIRDHFFTHENQPCWGVMVLYQVPVGADEVPEEKEASREKFKFRERLSEAQRGLFNALRDWRNEKAKAETVPPYIICTNEQLAQMVLMSPRTLEELAGVEGFGESRVQKHGREILAHIPGNEARGETDQAKRVAESESAEPAS